MAQRSSRAFPSSDSEGESLAERSPELYGVLLSLQEKVDNALFLLGAAMFAGVNGFCLGTHLAWWSTVGPLPVEKLQSGWLYAFVNVLGCLALTAIGGVLSKRAYRRHRDLLGAGIDEAGLNRYALITLLEDDPKLKGVATELKRVFRLDG